MTNHTKGSTHHAAPTRTNRTRPAGQPVRVGGDAADHWAHVDDAPVDVAFPRELPLHVVAWPSPGWYGIVFAAGMVAAAWVMGGMG